MKRVGLYAKEQEISLYLKRYGFTNDGIEIFYNMSLDEIYIKVNVKYILNISKFKLLIDIINSNEFAIVGIAVGVDIVCNDIGVITIKQPRINVRKITKFIDDKDVTIDKNYCIGYIADSLFKQVIDKYLEEISYKPNKGIVFNVVSPIYKDFIKAINPNDLNVHRPVYHDYVYFDTVEVFLDMVDNLKGAIRVSDVTAKTYMYKKLFIKTESIPDIELLEIIIKELIKYEIEIYLLNSSLTPFNTLVSNTSVIEKSYDRYGYSIMINNIKYSRGVFTKHIDKNIFRGWLNKLGQFLIY